jgi:HAD superfamily hydrolase (TIGR01490 family)
MGELERERAILDGAAFEAVVLLTTKFRRVRGMIPSVRGLPSRAWKRLLRPDKTIISKSSSLALSRPMYRAGMVTRGQLVRSAYAQLVYALVGADEKKMDRLKEGMLELTRGWDRAEVETLVRDVIIDVIDPYVYQEALDLMEQHRSEGRLVYIVSSSPEEVVRPVARHLGVAGVLATRAKIEDGKYTGELEFYCAGEGKAEALRELAERMSIDLGGSYAYSDSIADLPMLETVGHPVAVNPDRDLRKQAEEREWDSSISGAV